MSLGTYVLVRFSDAGQRLPALAVLKDCPKVRRWQAVDGSAHLVIRLDGPAAALPPEIQNLKGISELRAFEIVTDTDRETRLSSHLCHAYVFIECEPAKIAAITAALDGVQQVCSCAEVRGGCNLVAVIQGESFRVIERVVADKIQVLDGILRLKRSRVIDLQQL